jgi:lysyl-tRNA synthetase class 2
VLASVRRFFDERGVIEVETPVMGAATVTDPMLAPIAVDSRGLEGSLASRFWLQTSPEYPMKRLLTAGSGAIYQIARVFRRGERGPLHNPEFSLLEWYRPGFGYADLIDEIGELLALVLPQRPVVVQSYAQLFVEQLGIDPLIASDLELRAVADRHGVDVPAGLDFDAMLDLLMGTLIAPRLGRDCWFFVSHFPASQAALARLSPDDERTAERFECFIDGIEVANGFRELVDAAEQRRRFEADRTRRRERGEPEPPEADERLLAALEAGMPECSGVALGLDRLLMIALGAQAIDEVIAFPVERA